MQYFTFHEKEAGHGKIVNKSILLITMKSNMVTEVSENEILQFLLKSIQESIPTNFDERKIAWGEFLGGMPVFTVREIEVKLTIIRSKFEKTSERGLQFKNEGNLNADTIQTMIAKDFFRFKASATRV